MKNLLSFLVFLAVCSSASAEMKYIDDTLFVPLRSGEGTSFRIVHKGLKSGTPVEVIESNSTSGYSKIRTESGIEGYLPSRYLISTPIARQQLKTMKSKLAAAQKSEADARQQLKDIRSKYEALLTENETSLAQTKKLSKELADIKSISANAINLDARNRELRESNERLRNELELSRADNLRLKDKSESNSMLIGGVLVLAGIIAALLIPMLKPSKKNDGWA